MKPKKHFILLLQIVTDKWYHYTSCFNSKYGKYKP